MRFLPIFFTILFSSLFLISQNAYATDYEWNGSVSNLWSDPNNWDCDGGGACASAPLLLFEITEDSVLIDGGTVTMDVDVTFEPLGIFEIHGGATVTNNAILTTLDTNVVAAFEIADSIFINLGTIQNSGEISVFKSLFDNDNLLTNLGEIFIHATGTVDNSGGTVVSMSSINNFGLFCGGAFTGTASPNPWEPMCTSSNNPPTSSDTSITEDEDTNHTFAESEFPYNDPDGDPLVSITIETLPLDGALELSGTPVTPSQLIMAANIPNLVYIPLPDDNGFPADSFTFTVSDGMASSSPPNTMSINLNPVNDPPIANDDEYTLNNGGKLAVNSVEGVLSNDEDADGDELTAILED